MYRICSKCNIDYEDYGQRHKLCRSCKRVYDREYHHSRTLLQKSVKLENQRKRVLLNKQYIWDYLKLNPCSDCGEQDPILLEFDHLDRATKVGNISEMSTLSLIKIKEEISKCRVMCANCHRRHTANQLGWYREVVK